MAIHVNQWSPDTCGCVLEYQWDDAVSAAKRVHTFTRTIKKCSAHSAVGATTPSFKDVDNSDNGKLIYDAVVEENTRKNLVLQRALETKPELADIVDSRTQKRYDADTVAKQMKITNHVKAAEELHHGLVLKEDVEYKWRWVEDKITDKNKPRTLEIDFDIPQVSVDRAISVGSASKTIIKQKAIGDTDTLQKVLDDEFNPSKNRGSVKLKVTN